MEVRLHTICCSATIIYIIIWSKFFFLFIGREPTTWTANNFLQMTVCWCATPSNSVWLKCFAANNILLMREGNRAFLLLAIALAWKWQIATLLEDIHLKNKLGDNKLWQIIDLLATDKSRYFAQPRPIIANYLPKPKADANNWSGRQWQITIICNNRVQ